MGFLRKYSGVLPETHLTFGQAIHEVTQPLLRSTENANEVAIFTLVYGTFHMSACERSVASVLFGFSQFLRNILLAYTTYIRMVYRFIC